MTIDALYNHILVRLAAMRRRILVQLWAERLGVIAVWVAGGSAVVVVLEVVFHFPPPLRWLALAALAGVCITVGIRQGRKPVRIVLGWDDDLSDERLADRLGFAFGDIRDRLHNALQLHRSLAADRDLHSPDLVHAALESAGFSALERDFSEAADRGPLLRAGRRLGLLAAVWVALLMFWQAPISGGLERLRHPQKIFPLLPDFTLTVVPGDAEVVRGEPFEITVQVTGSQPDALRLIWIDETTGEETVIPLAVDASGVITHDFSDMPRTFRYRVQGVDHSLLQRDRMFQTAEFRVSVLHRPEIRRLTIRLDPPDYSGLPGRYLDDNIGDIAALKGTRVTLEATANKGIATAFLRFDNDRTIPLESAGSTVQGEFVLEESGRYFIALTDDGGLTNDAPIEYWVSAMADEYPMVQIVDPGKDTDLDDRMLVDLFVRALDDFGFTRARLGYEILREEAMIGDETGPTYLPIDMPDRSAVSQELRYRWDLSVLPLIPDDRIRYFVEVFDNDRVSGPKKSVSEVFHVRFPSLMEIFAEVEQTQDAGIEAMEDVLEEHREIRDALQEMVEEFRRDPEMRWETERELSEIQQQQDALQQQIEEVRQHYEDMLDKMENQDMVSMETLQKFMEMQELFEQLLTPELQAMIQKMQEQMQQQVRPEDMQAAMQDIQMSQEDQLRRLERTVSILKQIQMEQQMDQAVKMAEDLLKRQQEINEQIPQEAPPAPPDTPADSETEPAPAAPRDPAETQAAMERLAAEEARLQENAESLQAHVAKLLEEGMSLAELPVEQLAAAQEMMGEQPLMAPMQQTEQALSRNQPQEAQRAGRQARRQMQDIRDQMEAARQSMIRQQKQELMAGMSRAAQDLVTLSRREETVKNQVQGLDRASPRYRDLAQDQADLMAGLNQVAQRLVKMSQQTFFITPQMGKSLGQAMQEMAASLKQLEERNASAAHGEAGDAMAALNRTTQQVGDAMQQLASGASASGFQEYLEQLEQMAGMQQGINDQTADLPLGMSPGAPRTVARSMLMQRLAEQQRMLQESLKNLSRDMGQRDDVLGDLNNVADQMDDIIKDLESRNVNPRTLQSQRRILSRLLDAQRSLHRRDYSRKRKSETGREAAVIAPGALPANLGETLRLLQEELLRAMEEGYSKDYEDLIRRYFEALTRFDGATPRQNTEAVIP